MNQSSLKLSLNRLAFVFQPKNEQFASMLNDLAGKIGWRALAAVLGVSQLTLDSWRKCRNGPSAGARKLVWVVWALVFHREKLQSLFDVATWGRFSREHDPERDGPNVIPAN